VFTDEIWPTWRLGVGVRLRPSKWERADILLIAVTTAGIVNAVVDDEGAERRGRSEEGGKLEGDEYTPRPFCHSRLLELRCLTSYARFHLSSFLGK
jgi:hypothetical protein